MRANNLNLVLIETNSYEILTILSITSILFEGQSSFGVDILVINRPLNKE